MDGGNISICHSVDDRVDDKDVKVDEKEVDEEILCTYISLVSRDKLLLNISPQGLNVVTSVVDVCYFILVFFCGFKVHLTFAR